MSKRWHGLLLFLVLISGSRAAEAAFSATPATVEFNSVAIGANSIKPTTLKNDAPVTASITLGAGCTEFSSTTLMALAISNTGTLVNFTFTPATAGNKTCTATVTNDADSTMLGSFTLHGVATGTPTLDLSTTTLAFGNVGIGETTATMHVRATNNGNDVLKISGAAIFAVPANYVVTGIAGAQDVAAGDHADWDIACKPGLVGNDNDTFNIASNVAGSPSKVTVTCNGQQGVLTVDTSADFGSVALGDSVTKNITLTNIGNVDVTGIAAALDNNAVGYSVVAGTVPMTLAPNDPKTVMVKFAPTNASDGVTSHLTFSGTWTVGSAHPTTASTTLTGKTIALALTPAAGDFGDFRYDAMPKRPFTLSNNGTSAVIISSITLTPDAGTVAGELPLAITLNGVTANLANPLPAGSQYVIEVTAKPANRVGAIGGKIVATTSAGVALSPVTVKGNATAAMIQLTDANFGAVDIQAGPKMLTAVIKNTTTDTALLDVSAVTVSSSQNTAAAFSYTPPAAQSIGPGMTINIPITYTPTTQRTVGDEDKVVLVATLVGALNGPKVMTITMSGRGIDRDLALPAAPVVPAAFRNPGDGAPIVPITIQNTGEATMTVNGIMIDGGPVWQLLDDAAVDIPGGTSHDFMVKFAPTDVGPAPHGQLLFKTNDTTKPTALIPLDGAGVPRNVQFGPSTNVEPRTINLGVTGVNLPITLDSALVVASTDPGATYKIHRIELAAGEFTLDDAPSDDALTPMQSKSYAVTFDPSKPGHFEVMATLYLDEDPVPHAQVLLVGDAVFVEAHGGGGCNAGGGGGLLLGLAALLLRRRRVAS